MTPAEFFRDRKRLFWLLNIAGWTGYAVTAYLGALAHDKADSYYGFVAAAAFAGFLKITRAHIPAQSHRRSQGIAPTADQSAQISWKVIQLP